MHVGEYILALVAIVLGLALAEMATSVDRLVKRRKEVRLDAASLLAAGMIFYAVVANLWAQYAHYRNVTSAKLSEGAIMILTFLVTYLMAALVLPDEWEGQLDLRDHYERIRKPLWTLFGLNVIAVFVANIIRTGEPHSINYISLGTGLAMSAALILLKHRPLQIAILVVVFASLVLSLGDLQING